MANEVRMFSELLETSDKFMPAMIKGSRSEQDAKQRIKCYNEVFAQYEDIRNSAKMYSSYTDSQVLSNQYFNATTTGLAKSFAGLLSIERSMDAATALLWYMNVLDVNTSANVLPNIGPESIGNYRNQSRYTANLVTGTDNYQTLLAVKIVPKSVKLTITRVDSSVVTITDDGQGNLLSAANVLTVGTVNYLNGTITYDFTAAFTPVNTDALVITAAQDQTGISGVNRFKADLLNYTITTHPEILIGESNLASVAAMKKATSANPDDIIMGKLIELYTKMVNSALVNAIDLNYTGTVTDITITQSQFLDYRSTIDKFAGELNAVNQVLATQSTKGCRATAYVCGANVISQFEKCAEIGLYVEEPSSYINDLKGYYKGVPVLEHTNIGTNYGYAVHKTLDGQLAPCIRGMFLPLTNTPAVGNYDNPSQYAAGVYYQEAAELITPQLATKFHLVTS